MSLIRRSRAQQGSSLVPPKPPGTPVDRPVHVAELVSFRLQITPGYGDKQFMVTSEGEQKYKFVLRYSENDASAMVLDAKDPQGRVIARAIFPHSRYVLEVRLFQASYTIDVRQFDGDEKVARMSFELLHRGKEGKRARNAWNRASDILGAMPIDVLRYVNIPRQLDAAERKQIAQKYNLRSGRPVMTADTQYLEVFLPNGAYIFQYTKTLASPFFLKRLAAIQAGRQPYQTVRKVSEAVAAFSSAGLAPAPVAVPTPSLGSCSVCQKGMVPITKGQLNKKRGRNEWIGCQEGVECRSRSFWFHIGECAGVSARDLGKSGKWWCPECRKHKNNVPANGVRR